MCGRFTITVDRVELILKKFQATPAPGFEDYQPRYNAAPSQIVPVVVAKEDGSRYLTGLLWSLTPPWAEKPSSGYTAQINVRDDTIGRNKYFLSLLRERRCIFVADGFYEWRKPPEGEKGTPAKAGGKTPFRIHLRDNGLFAMAGLWRTVEAGGKKTLTGAIITTGPNEVMKPIHNRMPVLLDDRALELWLDPGVTDDGKLRSLLAPAPDDALEAYPVSSAVNNARFDSEICVNPA
jgi:putative SOS response-associated peptidase YedK